MYIYVITVILMETLFVAFQRCTFAKKVFLHIHLYLIAT